MSKGYVIKNKEGKYFVTFFGKPIFSKEISEAYMNADKQNLNYIINDKSIKDCTIVPITICEGDLEEENRVLKKALELACERIKNMYEQEQQYCTNEIENFVEVEKNYFIQQAKESEKDGV